MNTMAKYGAQESNPIPEGYHDTPITGRLDWDDPQLARVTRLRLISDPGFPAWDVSYCHGVDVDGNRVDVELPFDQLPKRGARRAIVAYAKADGVYAKRLGILENISTLI